MSIIDGHHDPPNQQKESRFVDSSGKLFSIYSSVAEAEDDKMVERWQNDANGILIFVSPVLAFMISCA